MMIMEQVAEEVKLNLHLVWPNALKNQLKKVMVEVCLVEIQRMVKIFKMLGRITSCENYC